MKSSILTIKLMISCRSRNKSHLSQARGPHRRPTQLPEMTLMRKIVSMAPLSNLSRWFSTLKKKESVLDELKMKRKMAIKCKKLLQVSTLNPTTKENRNLQQKSSLLFQICTKTSSKVTTANGNTYFQELSSENKRNITLSNSKKIKKSLIKMVESILLTKQPWMSSFTNSWRVRLDRRLIIK